MNLIRTDSDINIDANNGNYGYMIMMSYHFVIFDLSCVCSFGTNFSFFVSLVYIFGYITFFVVMM